MSTTRITSVFLLLLVAVVIHSEGRNAVFDKHHTLERTALSPEDYFASLIDQFDHAIHRLGVENLPVKDFVKVYDETVNGIKLEGYCSYTLGQVTNVDPFLLTGPSMEVPVVTSEGYLRGYIDLPNIEVIYHFHAQLTVDNVSGTATHVYPNNRIRVIVQRNTNVEGSRPTVTVEPWGVGSTNYTVYVPDTRVTQALAKVARLGTGYIFQDDVEAWCNDVFKTILQQIVDSMGFPW